MENGSQIGIVGSGMIGRSWAMLFASAGYKVKMFDTDKSKISSALTEILTQLEKLSSNGLLRGSLTPVQQMENITGATSLEDCVAGSVHVQECVFEDVGVKTKIFADMDSICGPNTILASSSSAFPPSLFTKGLKHSHNCLVNHPINPPYYIRLVEIIPAPWTKPEVVEQTKHLMEKLKQSPVCFKKEITGFGVNRIQGALLNECHHLVTDNYLSVTDVDTLMSEGLGMRYAWMGPFETMHLNANGMKACIQVYGPSINAINKTLKPNPHWDVESSKSIIAQMDERVPSSEIQSRRDWRDERLESLARLKSTMEKKEKTN